jgi:tRNA1(Val) A37 N6-methylase TrmN6
MSSPPQTLPPDWPDDAVWDQLSARRWFWQRRRGHRTSTDDLLVAWQAVATTGTEAIGDYLDLGCGVGSVLLMVADRLKPVRAVGVEAQPQSVLLLQQTLARGPASPPVEVVGADFRAWAERTGRRFDLITGSPPYLPPGTGVPSPDPQRHACRFELRGGVEAYLAAAARVARPHARVHIVQAARDFGRVMEGAQAAGLQPVTRCDVWLSARAEAPLLSVWGFRVHPEGPGAVLVAPPASTLVVRDAEGVWSPAWAQVRAVLELPGAPAPERPPADLV